MRLRAIENRVPLIKVSNYGWSLYIDFMGTIVDRKNGEISVFEFEKPRSIRSIYRMWGVYLTLAFALTFLVLSLIFKR